jgi:hypothetical protein
MMKALPLSQSQGINYEVFNRLRRLRQKHLNSSTSLCPFSDKGVIYVIYSVNNSRMLYVGQTCKSAFKRFQEHIREAGRLSKLVSSFFDFKPLYMLPLPKRVSIPLEFFLLKK